MPIEYTKEDLERLQEMVPPSNPLAFLLKKNNFDPVWFEGLMKKWPREHALIYDTPLEDLPLDINDTMLNGIRTWRFFIRK
jgi:hypothetical protein